MRRNVDLPRRARWSSWSCALAATIARAATRPVLGLDLQGGISVVLAPVGDVQARLARRRRRHHPQPGRQPRRRRARDQPPGRQHRRRPPRREGPRQGRAASSARPPSCGSGRCCRGHPARKTPTTTTTTAAPDDADARHDRDATATRRPPRRPRRPRRRTPMHDEAAGTPRSPSCDPTAVASRDPSVADVPKIHASRDEDKRDDCVVLPDKPGGPTRPRYYLGPAGLTGERGQLGGRRVRPGPGLDGRRWTSPTAGSSTVATSSRRAAVPEAGRDRARRRRAVGARVPGQTAFRRSTAPW